MSQLLAPLRRRPVPGPIITEIPLRCDRDVCTDKGHPWHIIRIETQFCGVADIEYRVSATIAGHRLRAPWNFADRAGALLKHSELVHTFRQFAAATEILAGAR